MLKMTPKNDFDEEFYEFNIDGIVGLDEAISEPDVNYYEDWCICLKDNATQKQVQLSMDYDRLIDLAKLLKPYLDGYEAQMEVDKENNIFPRPKG